MKKSFFKEYYLYKLRNLRGFFIASCVLNLLNLPLFVISIILTSTNVINMSGSSDLSNIYNYYGAFTFLYMMLSVLPGLLFLGFIIPPVSKKHNFRRECADTIGTLPLTHTQRYFGDVLAELTVYVLPLVVCSVFSIILSLVSEINLFDNSSAYNLLEMSAAYLFACVGIIAFSEMISQLCGKCSAAVIYSFCLGILFPFAIFKFGSIIEKAATGLENLTAAAAMCSAIPPFGTVIAKYFFIFTGEVDLLDFSQDAFSVIVFIVFTILFFAVGYFAGKSRKSEFIGQKAFMHKATGYVISSFFAAAFVCLAFPNKEDKSFADNGSPVPYIIAAAIGAIVVFFIFEFIHKGRSIKIRSSLICCVAVTAVSMGLCLTAQATHGFGAEDYVPDARSVSEIEVRTNMFVTSANYTYTDKTAVSVLTGEHRKLLENKNALTNDYGYNLEITYKLKSGAKIVRSYHSKYESVFEDYSSTMLSIPTDNSNLLTVLTDDTVKISHVEFELNHNSKDIEDYSDYEIHTVKPDRTDELRSLLYSDIMSNIGLYKAESFAQITITAELANGTNTTQYYDITTDYTNTTAFLRNPDNVTSAPQSACTVDDYFEVTVSYGDSYITAVFQPKYETDRRIPEELLSLFTTKNEAEELSELFEIRSTGGMLYIRKTDEAKAMKLFFSALEETYS